jgi:hypothetical protein
MSNTRFVFLPQSAEFPSANFPQLKTIHSTERRYVLAFDEAMAESAMWTFIAPQGLTGGLSAVVTYCMASATSGKVDFTVEIEAVSDGDSLDLDAATGYDTANAITAPTVPGTAGYVGQFTCELTNDDGMAAGDLCRLRLTRDATDETNDTASGDCYVLAVELQDGN